MENWMLWLLNVFVGLLVTFGGIILKNVRDEIRDIVSHMKEIECKVERESERLDRVIMPNVGVSMCNKVQEQNKAAFEYFGAKCEKLDQRGLENREALIRFEGKIDNLLQEVRSIARKHNASDV